MKNWCIVIASGPSLTRADCDALRGMEAIAVNNAVFLAPWAQTLYAADSRWWSVYKPRITWYKGQRLCRARGIGIETYYGQGWQRNGGNSGHQALQLAVERGYKHIALIGFDHMHTGGKSHFHGDHVGTDKITLGNAPNTHHWATQMNRTAGELKARGIEIINLSRETALECFERVTVEAFIDSRNN